MFYHLFDNSKVLRFLRYLKQVLFYQLLIFHTFKNIQRISLYDYYFMRIINSFLVLQTIYFFLIPFFIFLRDILYLVYQSSVKLPKFISFVHFFIFLVYLLFSLLFSLLFIIFIPFIFFFLILIFLYHLVLQILILQIMYHQFFILTKLLLEFYLK